MRDIPSLTGLRGVAAIWVMLFHVSQMAPAIGAPWVSRIPLLPAGWVGVDLFFVLSGFILMWVHGADFARPSLEAVSRFAAARIVRVYPLSLVVLALIVLLARSDPAFVAWYKTQNPDNFSAVALARTALLATRWGPAGGDWNQPVWSLSAELVGYAAFPLLAWLILARSAREAAAIAAICLASLAGLQISRGAVGVNAIDQISVLARMACCFTAGMAACRVRQLSSDRAAAFAPLASLIVCIALGACCQFRLGTLLAPAGFTLVIFSLSFRAGYLDGFLSSKPVIFLGKISFPLYLLHAMPLLWLVSHYRHAGLGPMAATAVLSAYGVACIAAAALLHYLVERPSHRWARPRLTPPASASLQGLAS